MGTETSYALTASCGMSKIVTPRKLNLKNHRSENLKTYQSAIPAVTVVLINP
jgi:hypothetical protein